ncbi:MAG: hypothetical protein LC643_10090, partial [Bacteroidales bacterium]|nr:hypothetical protein [Bacteroidales bacterium]
KGRVQPRKSWNDDQEQKLEVKVNKISLLSEVLESQVQSMMLRIPLQGLTHEVVTELAQISMENRGKVTLRFQVYDEENERQQVQLLSRSVSVSLTSELVRFFEERPEISMSLS